MIGRFLEISIHAPDVLASLGFYERLGFTQVATGEAWSYPYAVVTDGRLAIGLHQRELPRSPLLAFVLPELFGHVDGLERLGIEILDRRLGSDVFNEVSFETPGGHLLRLLEARTFSPSQRAPGATSRLGWFEEVALPVDDVKTAEDFWERLGFAPVEEGEDPLSARRPDQRFAECRAGTPRGAQPARTRIHRRRHDGSRSFARRHGN